MAICILIITNNKPMSIETSGIESQKEKELSPQEKEKIGSIWVNLVVDGVLVPENIEQMTESEIKKWFFESLMQDTGRLLEEFRVKVDEGLTQEIQQAQDPEKSELEIKYIKDVHRQVDELIQDPYGSSRWDSWPKQIRESRKFNCVGAALMGTYLLEKSGIKSFLGNPFEHTLNIVQLSNGKWWHVDFANGQGNVFEINPEVDQLDGITILRSKNGFNDYKLIPIKDNSEITASVMGNLSAIQEFAKGQEYDSKDAKQYLQDHSDVLADVDLSDFYQTFYSDRINFHNHPEIKAEAERIKSLRKN